MINPIFEMIIILVIMVLVVFIITVYEVLDEENKHKETGKIV